MTTSLIIFTAALILCAGVLVNKKRESAGGWHVRIGSSSADVFFSKMSQTFKMCMLALELESLKKTSKYALHYVERHVINVIEKLGHRFEIAGHAVMGRNIPKNRGSVSFFLKNIENRKKGGLIK